MAKANGLEEFVEDLNRWRNSREKLGPLPEALWEEAGRMARVFGIGPTATAAGLNHARVRARAEGIQKTKAKATASPFVQLPTLAINGSSTSSGHVVEARTCNGDSLRLEQFEAQDAAVLLRVFLGRPA